MQKILGSSKIGHVPESDQVILIYLFIQIQQMKLFFKSKLSTGSVTVKI